MSLEILPPGADLFASGAQALVNPADTTGAQGKGLALAFRRKYPLAAELYEGACRDGKVQIGRVFLVGAAGRTIVFFPSKRHWREKSRIEDIRAGLGDMVRRLLDIDCRSVAVPALGCGLGELAWSDVRPLLIEAAERLSAAGLRVLIYEPHEQPAPRRRR